MKKVIMLMISIIIGVLVYQKNDEIIIPEEAIRVRIIANSNNIKDLYEKKKLKDDIKSDLYNLVKESKSFNEASENIKNNLNNINELVSTKTTEYKIEYGVNYFPKKTYKGVIYPEGDYESLIITLGKGLGDNWWCVLYPPICMIDDNENTKDVEYQWLVSKVLSLH